MFFRSFLLLARRNGRAVECTGLENRHTERYRGFESLFLRHKIPASDSWDFLFQAIEACFIARGNEKDPSCKSSLKGFCGKTLLLGCQNFWLRAKREDKEKFWNPVSSKRVSIEQEGFLWQDFPLGCQNFWLRAKREDREKFWNPVSSKSVSLEQEGFCGKISLWDAKTSGFEQSEKTGRSFGIP